MSSEEISKEEPFYCFRFYCFRFRPRGQTAGNQMHIVIICEIVIGVVIVTAPPVAVPLSDTALPPATVTALSEIVILPELRSIPLPPSALPEPEACAFPPCARRVT